MLADLTTLLDALPASAEHADYQRAVMEDNALGKRTASTRLWAWKKLRELYALDPTVPIFRMLRELWRADASGRPLLALLAALARDALLRASATAIVAARPGVPVTKEQLRQAIVQARGDRFSKSTMDAVLSHLMSSWTESGHLMGRKEKVRAHPTTTTAATTYALALGYLASVRGTYLLSTLWTSVLDAPESVLHDHAREASRRGWLVYRGVGNIVDIDFPSLRPSAELAGTDA
jgi:hypothetical protein